MGKRITGWILFGVGIPYYIVNLVSIGSDFFSGQVDGGRLAFSLSCYSVIAFALIFSGWKLAHSKPQLVKES
jgi:hypothetical protein